MPPHTLPKPDVSPLDQAVARLQIFRTALGGVAIDEAVAASRRHAPAGQVGASVGLRTNVADSTAMLGRVGTADTADLLGAALKLTTSLMASLRSDLLARLDEQLPALPGAVARDPLRRYVPHWRVAHAMR